MQEISVNGSSLRQRISFYEILPADAIPTSDDHILGGCRVTLAKVDGWVNWGVGGGRAFSESWPCGKQKEVGES